jgi:hypothetical protein
MQQAKIVIPYLFPTHKDAAVAVQARRRTLDDPAASSLAAYSWLVSFIAPRMNVGRVAAPAGISPQHLTVVSQIAAEMMTMPTGGSGPGDRDAGQSLMKEFLIARFCGGNGHADRHTSAIGKNRPFDAELTTIGRISSGFFSRPAKPWPSNRRGSAKSTQCVGDDRSASAPAATTNETRLAASILESNDELCCLCQTDVAVPSIGSPFAAKIPLTFSRSARGLPP